MQCDLLGLNKISLTSANKEQNANITRRAAQNCARRIISSAYAKQPKYTCPVKQPILSFSKPVKRLLIYILNKKGNKIAPCLSPFSDKNDSDIQPFQRTHRDNWEYNKSRTLAKYISN